MELSTLIQNLRDYQDFGLSQKTHFKGLKTLHALESLRRRYQVFV